MIGFLRHNPLLWLLLFVPVLFTAEAANRWRRRRAMRSVALGAFSSR
jgi:hypothetical protein